MKHALVLLLLMLPLCAHATTFYVSSSSSNTSSCGAAQSQTGNNPMRTMNGGIGCMSGGDTLIVKPGTYAEILDQNIPSGSTGAPTLVKSEVQHAAIIAPGSSLQSSLCGTVGTICICDQHDIILDGFTIDGAGLVANYHVYFRSCSSQHHITIQFNDIKNGADNNTGSDSNGIVVGPGSSFITIRNNKIHHMGVIDENGNACCGDQRFYSYGIYFYPNDTLVESNEIYSNSGYGIHSYNGVGPQYNNRNIIRNNYIHDNQGSGVLFASAGDRNQLYNNILANNGYPGGGNRGTDGLCVSCSGSTMNSEIYNNTIVGNNKNCITNGNSTTISTTIRNNICANNGNNVIDVPNQTNGNTVAGNLFTANPQFATAPPAPRSPTLWAMLVQLVTWFK